MRERRIHTSRLAHGPPLGAKFCFYFKSAIFNALYRPLRRHDGNSSLPLPRFLSAASRASTAAASFHYPSSPPLRAQVFYIFPLLQSKQGAETGGTEAVFLYNAHISLRNKSILRVRRSRKVLWLGARIGEASLLVVCQSTTRTYPSLREAGKTGPHGVTGTVI